MRFFLKNLPKSLLVLVLGLYGSALSAASVCFDWDCTVGNRVCSFDPGCSTPQPSPNDPGAFFWDFGDGSTGTSGSSGITHAYGIAPDGSEYSWANVTLEATFLSCQPTVTCEIVIRNVIGPPHQGTGRCSAFFPPCPPAYGPESEEPGQ